MIYIYIYIYIYTADHRLSSNAGFHTLNIGEIDR